MFFVSPNFLVLVEQDQNSTSIDNDLWYIWHRLVFYAEITDEFLGSFKLMTFLNLAWKTYARNPTQISSTDFKTRNFTVITNNLLAYMNYPIKYLIRI